MMTKHIVVQYEVTNADAIGGTLIPELPPDRDFKHCGLTSIVEAAMNLTCPADYVIALEYGIARPLNQEEQEELAKAVQETRRVGS